MLCVSLVEKNLLWATEGQACLVFAVFLWTFFAFFFTFKYSSFQKSVYREMRI